MNYWTSIIQEVNSSYCSEFLFLTCPTPAYDATAQIHGIFDTNKQYPSYNDLELRHGGVPSDSQTDGVVVVVDQDTQTSQDPSKPCEVCRKENGSLVCSVVSCPWRHDCEGIYTPGVCCPSYLHCPNTAGVLTTSLTPFSLLAQCVADSSKGIYRYHELYTWSFVRDLNTSVTITE